PHGVLLSYFTAVGPTSFDCHSLPIGCVVRSNERAALDRSAKATIAEDNLDSHKGHREAFGTVIRESDCLPLTRFAGDVPKTIAKRAILRHELTPFWALRHLIAAGAPYQLKCAPLEHILSQNVQSGLVDSLARLAKMDFLLVVRGDSERGRANTYQ